MTQTWSVDMTGLSRIRVQNRVSVRDRVGVSHDTRVEDGSCELHREGSGGADGIRGDDMGVGACDISEFPGDSWGSGHTTGSDDGWETVRELDSVMVGRHGRVEQDT